MSQYGKLKDTGDIIDLDMANKDTANIKQYYKTTIEILKRKLGG